MYKMIFFLKVVLKFLDPYLILFSNLALVSGVFIDTFVYARWGKYFWKIADLVSTARPSNFSLLDFEPKAVLLYQKGPPDLDDLITRWARAQVKLVFRRLRCKIRGLCQISCLRHRVVRQWRTAWHICYSIDGPKR